MTNLIIPAAALESHIGILGKTGSGKSNLAKVLAEQLMYAKERVCVVDPTGTWWGLRLSADGKKSSRFSPIIFGGDHGDMPLGEHHGDVLAEAVGTSADSAIIDTQQMKVGERTRFFTDFAETLLRTNRGKLTLIIDEAHIFAPQAGARAGGAMPAMLHAANNLLAMGRGRGLRIILITQRPAKLAKDSLTQVETLIAMRLIAPQDRNAVKDWVGEWADKSIGDDLIASLPSLPVGDAWVWSPQINYLERKHFPLAATFDSGQPEVNASVRELPKIDLAKIGDKMDTIRQEAMENDPKRLKVRVAEAERLLAVERAKPASAPQVDASDIVAAFKRGWDQALQIGGKMGADQERNRLGKIVLDFAGDFAVATNAAQVKKFEAPYPDYIASVKSAGKILDLKNGSPRFVAVPPVQTKPPTTKELGTKPEFSFTVEGIAITDSQQRALDAIAWWRALGFLEVSRQRAAIIGGWSPTASTFGVYTSQLQKLGLVELGAETGSIRLTEVGITVANAPQQIDRGMVLERALEILGKQAAAALRIVAAAWPGPISRDEVADDLGLSRTASTTGVYLSECGRLGFIEVAGKGIVKAADWLFPETRR